MINFNFDEAKEKLMKSEDLYFHFSSRNSLRSDRIYRYLPQIILLL